MTKARKRNRDCGRKLAAFLAVGMLALCAAADKAPVKIIFDTDMIGDYDDVGAMAVLHKLADAGECEILATVSSTHSNASAGTVELINRWYGRPDIPVAALIDDLMAAPPANRVAGKPR